MFRRGLVLLLPVLAAGAVCGAVRAEDETDSARARAALQRGDIRPLAGILASIEDRFDGRVIETELECPHGRWIYEFKLLPPTGRLFKVRVDAATGSFIETHGPAQERP